DDGPAAGDRPRGLSGRPLPVRHLVPWPAVVRRPHARAGVRLRAGDPPSASARLGEIGRPPKMGSGLVFGPRRPAAETRSGFFFFGRKPTKTRPFLRRIRSRTSPKTSPDPVFWLPFGSARKRLPTSFFLQGITMMHTRRLDLRVTRGR